MEKTLTKWMIMAAFTSLAIILNAAPAEFPVVENQKTAASEVIQNVLSVTTESDYIKPETVTDSLSDVKAVKSDNPLYQGNGKEVTNPLYESQKSGYATRTRVEVLKSNRTGTQKGRNKGWDGTVKGNAATADKSINNLNNGMPNRISMNITVAKQTQGATFGEKVNSGLQAAGIITIRLVKDGCVVLFPDNQGYRVFTAGQSIRELTSEEHSKINSGLQAAGGALAQGASLLGGALPGGSIVSAAISSVSAMAGSTGSGAAAASYARTAASWLGKDDDCDGTAELAEGDYVLEFLVSEKASSGLKDTLKTQVRIGFSYINNVLKTKHDTAKNTINNVR